MATSRQGTCPHMAPALSSLSTRQQLQVQQAAGSVQRSRNTILHSRAAPASSSSSRCSQQWLSGRLLQPAGAAVLHTAGTATTPAKHLPRSQAPGRGPLATGLRPLRLTVWGAVSLLQPAASPFSAGAAAAMAAGAGRTAAAWARSWVSRQPIACLALQWSARSAACRPAQGQTVSHQPCSSKTRPVAAAHRKQWSPTIAAARLCQQVAVCRVLQRLQAYHQSAHCLSLGCQFSSSKRNPAAAANRRQCRRLTAAARLCQQQIAVCRLMQWLQVHQKWARCLTLSCQTYSSKLNCIAAHMRQWSRQTAAAVSLCQQQRVVCRALPRLQVYQQVT